MGQGHPTSLFTLGSRLIHNATFSQCGTSTGASGTYRYSLITTGIAGRKLVPLMARQYEFCLFEAAHNERIIQDCIHLNGLDHR